MGRPAVAPSPVILYNKKMTPHLHQSPSIATQLMGQACYELMAGSYSKAMTVLRGRSREV